MKIKSRYIKVGVCILIFFSLIGISNMLFRPVYNKIGKQMQTSLIFVSKRLHDKAGLRISYKSLSPSIFRGIVLKDIYVFDTESEKLVASIRRLSLSYSILSFLKGDTLNAFESLSLRDIEIEVEEGKSDFWLKKILQNSGEENARNADDSNSAIEIESDSISQVEDSAAVKRIFEVLESLDISVLRNVRVYRLHAVYKKKAALIEAEINKATSISGKNENTDAKVDGSFNVQIADQKISGNLDFSATVPKGFDGSSAVLRFGNIKASEYRARYLGFIAEYKNKNFNLKMLPSEQSVYAEFNAALESGDLGAKILADNFNLARLFQTSNREQLTQSIFAMNFSLDGEAKYNLNTKKFSYNSKGNIYVPSGAIPAKEYASDILVSYSVYGDENKITVPYLQTSGERYNLNFDGSFDFTKMRPDGNLYVDSFVLPSGGTISTELYIEPSSTGFMCFSPQISFDDRTFTAAQLDVIQAEDSWDFTFEVSDYSHPEAETPGTLSLYGSFAPSSNALQTSLSFNTIYLDSIVLMYAFFADQNIKPLLEKAAEITTPFVFSCDAFASGEKGDYAFNVPYAFIANTVRDDQMLMLSADGNQENIHLSRLEFAFAKQRLLMNADTAVLGEGQGRVMNGRLELNEIPYDFTGFLNENWLNINSEYGFQFSLSTDTSGEEAVLSGSLASEDFPLSFGGHTYSLSNETSFSYSVSNGLNINFPRFECSVIDKTLLNPVVSFSGNLNPQMFVLDDISYSDSVSTLNGNGSVFWLSSNGILEDATFTFGLSNLTGLERIALSGNVSNPMQTPFSMSTLFSGEFLQSLFVTANFDVESLLSQRFVATSRESDSVNASLVLQGSLSNPFVTLSVPRAGFTVNNTPLVLTAEATFEDMVLGAHNVSLDFGSTQIKDLTASFDARKFSGDMKFDLQTEFLERKINTEVFAKAEAISEVGKKIPEAINFSFDTSDVIENNSKKSPPFHLGVVKMQDDFIISSSANLGLSGMVSNYKDINLLLKNPMPFEVAVQGTVANNELNLVFSDVNASLPKLLKWAGIEVIDVQKGNLSGGFAITGSPDNPCFSGSLDIVPAEFNCPSFFKRHATTDKITLLMDGSQFYTEPTRCSLHRTPVDVTVNVQMNRLAFESLDVHVKTVGESFAPLNMNLSEIHVKGNFGTDLHIGLENDTISVSGDLTAKDTNAEFGATRLNEILAGLAPKSQTEDDDDSYSVDVALNIKTLSRVQIAYSSFLRAVVVPGSEIEVTYFGDQSRLLLDGDVPIKSGEISYLNTNFVIKDGDIHFSDNDESFDPRISVHAETKTRDENNEHVTISLRVDNQHLSELSPRVSSSPAKSEREIMELLGNIITADSDNAAMLALSTGDYAIQTVFTRKLENVLRDLFKFDIFSLRTMVVQNAVKQGMNRNSLGDSNNSNPTGNYLDGTTVYIGKYLGDSIFADAMLRLDYDENRVGDKYTLNGLSFRPEIGFELESPFAKIRWSMSPDFEDLVNLNLVQNTALTLSWKFNF